MNTALKLRICDRSLGLTTLAMLASGLQLEATSGRYEWSVWAHIILGIILIILSIYHISLHYSFSNWFARFAKNKNMATKILWWVFLLTAVTGIMATAQWLVHFSHSSIGGIHGKIGFLMVIVAIVHAARHKKMRKRVKSK